MNRKSGFTLIGWKLHVCYKLSCTVKPWQATSVTGVKCLALSILLKRIRVCAH